MSLDVIETHMRASFTKAGLTSKEALQDDENIRLAAQAVQKQLPLAIRTTLRVVLGKDSIETYALKVRDLIVREMA